MDSRMTRNPAGGRPQSSRRPAREPALPNAKLSRRSLIVWLVCLFMLGLAGYLVVGVGGPRTPSSENQPSDGQPTMLAKSEEMVSDAVTSEESFPREALADEWQRQWQELMSCPDSPQRNQALIALLEKLAETDPARAMAFAETATDTNLRSELYQATLRGWAAMDPDGASAWAKTQNRMDRGLAMAAVLHGAVRNPEDAEDLVRRLSEQDPARAEDYGSYLIFALGRVGEFSRAAAFATGGSAEARMNWINAAYSRWAIQNPEAALASVAGLTDPDVMNNALAAALGGWGRRDPKAVADFGLLLPEGPERKMALTVLQSWSEGDVVGAANWLVNVVPSPEVDGSVVNIASSPRTLQQPQVAFAWANSIFDPQRRRDALVGVLENWLRADAASARNYVATSPDLQTDDRELLIQAMNR